MSQGWQWRLLQILRQDDCLSPGEEGQPEGHSGTEFQKKKRCLTKCPFPQKVSPDQAAEIDFVLLSLTLLISHQSTYHNVLSYSFSFTFISYVRCTCTLATVHTWKAEDNLWELFSPSTFKLIPVITIFVITFICWICLLQVTGSSVGQILRPRCASVNTHPLV